MIKDKKLLKGHRTAEEVHRWMTNGRLEALGALEKIKGRE